MRIVKSEKIFLSEKEANTLNAFDIILEEMEKKMWDPENIKLVQELYSRLHTLWVRVADIE